MARSDTLEAPTPRRRSPFTPLSSKTDSFGNLRKNTYSRPGGAGGWGAELCHVMLEGGADVEGIFRPSHSRDVVHRVRHSHPIHSNTHQTNHARRRGGRQVGKERGTERVPRGGGGARGARALAGAAAAHVRDGAGDVDREGRAGDSAPDGAHYCGALWWSAGAGEHLGGDGLCGAHHVRREFRRSFWSPSSDSSLAGPYELPFAAQGAW